MLMCLANIGDAMADIFRFIYLKMCCCGCCRRKGRRALEGQQSHEAWKVAYEKNKRDRSSREPPMVLEDDSEDEDDEIEAKISVPLTITVGVIAGYIFFGTVLFALWEKEWDTLIASYFCFITISTIGFGDIVPEGAKFERDGDEFQMIMCAIYMLFGMAILSMCFSLIQEEIVTKFKWVGEKIGIIEKNKDDEGDVDDNNPQQHTPSLPRSLPSSSEHTPSHRPARPFPTKKNK